MIKYYFVQKDKKFVSAVATGKNRVEEYVYTDYLRLAMRLTANEAEEIANEIGGVVKLHPNRVWL